MNQSDCWICLHLPTNTGRGHPVVATVFPSFSTIRTAFDNLSVSDYTGISEGNLTWQVDLSLLWNETEGVPCVQRCYLDTVETNRGGNKTDKRCGEKNFVGVYPNCTTYIPYRSPNM